METVQVLAVFCGAVVCFGGGYLWTTRKVAANPVQLLLGSGASLQVARLDSQIDAAQQKYADFIESIKHLPKDEKLQIWRSENEPMKAQLCILRQKRHELAMQLKKKGLYQPKTISIEERIKSDESEKGFVEKLNATRNYNPYCVISDEPILDLQPLNAAALKKKSKFDRLKSVIFEHPKVAQFVFNCAVFWESAQRFAVSFRYKLSIL